MFLTAIGICIIGSSFDTYCEEARQIMIAGNSDNCSMYDKRAWR